MTRLSLRWSGLERMRTCMSSEDLVYVNWSVTDSLIYGLAVVGELMS